MSSFNPNAPASGSFTGGQERRFKREESAEDKGKVWEEREARPRDGWLEEDRYDVNRGFPRYGGEQRRQPVDVGRWVEGGRIDDRELAPQDLAPAPWDPALAPLMPAADQEQEVRRWHKATAIWTDPAYHKQLQRDAQRRALFCRGCGGRHKQWDCPTRPVCQRCYKPGHSKETCLGSERDRRADRVGQGHPRFDPNLRRQQLGAPEQELEEEARLRDRRLADRLLREVVEEEEARRRERRRAARQEEEVEVEMARQRRAADRQAELDHERRLNDLLRDRVELQARVQAGPPLPAPPRGLAGPPPNAPTGPRAMARTSPLFGEPRVHKAQQRSLAFNLANRQQSVSRGLGSAGRANWVERDRAIAREPGAPSGAKSAAAVSLGESSRAPPRRKDRDPREGR